jgi:zinc protease
MFEGSQHYDRGYFQPLQEAGASLNGSTNADRTNYWEVVPRNALELALWMESDRMGYLLPALTAHKFDNQRDVVLNERRQNYENRPYGLASMALVASLYPPEPSVPLADDRRGRGPPRRAARRGARVLPDVLPPAERLAGAGRRFRHRRGAAAGERYFGLDPGATAPWSPRSRPRPLDAERRCARGPRRVAAALHGLALAGDVRPGDAELDLVAEVLATGKTSRLYRALVFEERIATEIAPRRTRARSAASSRSSPPPRPAGPSRSSSGHHAREARCSRGGPVPDEWSAAWRRRRRTSSTGCRPSAASAASRTS